MLVLSRRESETVVFPSLGISVEVTRVQGKTVRLGIDAPKEIRVVRGELKDSRKYESNDDQINNTSSAGADGASCTGDFDSPIQLSSIRKCLDAANLAIHLAQNQLQQQLTEHAEEALEHALGCLKNLQDTILDGEDSQGSVLKPAISNSSVSSNAISQIPIVETKKSKHDALNATTGYTKANIDSPFTPNSGLESVRETESGYRVDTNSDLENQKPKPIVLLLESNDDLRDKLTFELIQNGYRVLDFSEGISIIKYLENNRQPDAILTPENQVPSDKRNLTMAGVTGLTNKRHRIQIGGTSVAYSVWSAKTFELRAGSLST
ncbi:MAG: carbon storage regulator [Mariniblastus sp.]